MTDLNLPSGPAPADPIKPIAPSTAGGTPPPDVHTPVPVRGWPYVNLAGGVLAATSGITAAGMVMAFVVVTAGTVQPTAGMIAMPNLQLQTQPAGPGIQPATQPVSGSSNPAAVPAGNSSAQEP